jgi:hypothetical protein
METRNKLWLGLGVVCVASALSACGGDSHDGMNHAGSTEEGAEEGGEGGEGASTAESIASDAVYLGQLGFIRGHLMVGVELYQAGDEAGSETHMKHPESEIYADLLPALTSRDAPEFGEQLAALAVAVENRRPLPDVEAAYQAVLDGITAAEQAVSDPSARLLGNVIVDLVSTAAAEYDLAVGDDLALENAHEYQDSFGFMRVAYTLLDTIEAMNADSAITQRIREQMDSIFPAWSGLMAPERLHTQPSVIYGAASRVELAVSGL